MKRNIFGLFLIFTIGVSALLTGCKSDSITSNPVTSPRGIFILNEGLFNQPASYDYTFINAQDSTIKTSVYQNSNGGAFMNSNPDGLYLRDGVNLFITAQGNYGQAGTIYKIDAGTNLMLAQRNFGRNPYSLALSSNKVCVTNIAGSHVSVMDINFIPINDSVAVGPNPSEIVFSGDYFYVAKAGYTFENSLAIVNQNNLSVSKIYFNSPPVGVASNNGTVYISTYFSKMIYTLETTNNTLKDSVLVPATTPAISDIIAGDSHTLYVVSFDTATYTHKEVYKYDLLSKMVTTLIPYTAGSDIYGISFNSAESKIYIADSKGGLSNGVVRVYDINGNLVKTYSDIGGKYPRRFAFKN